MKNATKNNNKKHLINSYGWSCVLMNKTRRLVDRFDELLIHVSHTVIVRKALSQIDRIVVASQARELNPHIFVAHSGEDLIQIVMFAYFRVSVHVYCSSESFQQKKFIIKILKHLNFRMFNLFRLLSECRLIDWYTE